MLELKELVNMKWYNYSNSSLDSEKYFESKGK